jgi:hypothetical protein
MWGVIFILYVVFSHTLKHADMVTWYWDVSYCQRTGLQGCGRFALYPGGACGSLNINCKYNVTNFSCFSLVPTV